jgi:hypothetical protein
MHSFHAVWSRGKEMILWCTERSQTKYFWAVAVGIGSAWAWTWWTSSVAHGKALEVATSDLILLCICRQSFGWYQQGRDREWWCYAIISAATSGLLVHFGLV